MSRIEELKELGFSTVTKNDKLLLVCYTGTNTNVIIPSDIMAIDKNAFHTDAGQNVVELTIPNSVVEIHTGAFAELSKLKKVIIDGSEQLNLGFSPDLFHDCRALESVTYKGDIKISGMTAFYNCSNLKDVSLGAIENINSGTFMNCTSLKSIVLPDTVKHVKESAFRGCSNLTTVVLPAKCNANIIRNFTNVTSIKVMVYNQIATSFGTPVNDPNALLPNVHFTKNIYDTDFFDTQDD